MRAGPREHWVPIFPKGWWARERSLEKVVCELTLFLLISKRRSEEERGSER